LFVSYQEGRAGEVERRIKIEEKPPYYIEGE
jgi:hypothetical protein